MKKIIYLSAMFFCAYVSAQKSYQQYKKERQYAQRYANEQKQQNYKKAEVAIAKYNSLVNQYVNLVKKYKSTSYVDKNYSELSQATQNLQFEIQANWNYITYDQSKRFDEIRKKYLVTNGAYYDQ